MAAVVAGESIEFRAFTSRSILSGRYVLRADRLTDALNDTEKITLTEVKVLGFDALVEHELAELTVPRMDLLIVHATGPRGNPRRRFRVLPHDVTLDVGPYHLEATMHAGPGADPTVGIFHRAPMVPMTDARISYNLQGRLIDEQLGTVIVNQAWLSFLARSRDHSVFRREGSAATQSPVVSGREASQGHQADALLQPSRRMVCIVADGLAVSG